MDDYEYLKVLPHHGINGGYFAIDAVPISWLNAENLGHYSNDFEDDPDYIEHCKDLEFAVNEDLFVPGEALYFVRERFDPDFFANKLNAELGWNSNFPGEFDPWGANFYSMWAINDIKNECLKRAPNIVKDHHEGKGATSDEVDAALVAFYTDVAMRLAAMLELDWEKYVVCFYGP